MRKFSISAMLSGAALAFLALTSPATAMTFQLISPTTVCAQRGCVLATGDIDENSVQALIDFAKAAHLKPGSVIDLDSNGGNLMEGIRLGSVIRAAGYDTTVQGYDNDNARPRPGAQCASACVFAFLGGVERDVGPQSRIGVHQVSGRPDHPWDLTPSDSQWYMGMAAQQVKRMGGTIDLVVLALETPAFETRWLSPSELTRFGLVTVANSS